MLRSLLFVVCIAAAPAPSFAETPADFPPPPLPGDECAPACRPSANPAEAQDVVGDSGAPFGEHYELRRRKGLIITGSSLFAVGYALSAMFGVLAFDDSGSGTYLIHLVPLVGPAISRVLVTNQTRNLTYEDLIFTVIVSVLQVAGLTTALFGIPARRVLVEDDIETLRPRWSIAPFAPGSPLGVSLLIRN